MQAENIILIGMPASGKSTAGVLLAKSLGYGFVDCDLLIQSRERALLCDIIAEKGAEEFLRIEEEVCASLSVHNTVVATGGSVVYGERAMLRLRETGTVVYLKVAEAVLEGRLKDIFRRGVVMRKKGETVAELYAERAPLYEKYAQITVDCTALTVGQTVRAVCEALGV